MKIKSAELRLILIGAVIWLLFLIFSPGTTVFLFEFSFVNLLSISAVYISAAILIYMSKNIHNQPPTFEQSIFVSALIVFCSIVFELIFSTEATPTSPIFWTAVPTEGAKFIAATLSISIPISAANNKKKLYFGLILFFTPIFVSMILLLAFPPNLLALGIVYNIIILIISAILSTPLIYIMKNTYSQEKCDPESVDRE